MTIAPIALQTIGKKNRAIDMGLRGGQAAYIYNNVHQTYCVRQKGWRSASRARRKQIIGARTTNDLFA